jgi:peptidoglycan/LPS O-acetylase OafA/YrhL
VLGPHSGSLRPVTYRKEVDGLRALAVLPVILFHAGSGLCPGGFVGVDVFFVISGFLITANVLKEKSEGTFSPARFYERRARRILPALYAVMAACLPFSWLWMFPEDFENFGRTLLATAGFANNVFLWKTADYFDLGNGFKPLAHTWSLGVEEQYYLLFPPLFGALWRWGRKWMLPVGAACAAASAVLAAATQARDPNAAFYLLPFRAWELLLGVCAAVLAAGKRAQAVERVRAGRAGGALSLAGLCAIGVSLLAFTKDTPMSGLPGLLPTIGTALVLLFAGERNLAGRLLSRPPLVGVGLVSYSAYLWHQPLFAFARMRSLEEPPRVVMLTLAAWSLILAYFTWRFIEQPCRKRSSVPARRFWILAAAPGALLFLAGGVIHLNEGFPGLWPDLRGDLREVGRALNATYNTSVSKYRDLPFLDPARPNVLVLGNSYARDVVNAGIECGAFRGSEVSYSPFAYAVQDLPAGLRQRVAEADLLILGYPPSHPEVWPAIERMLLEMKARRIVVIGAKVFAWNMKEALRLAAEDRRGYSVAVRPSYAEHNRRCREFIPPERYVDLLELLAGPDGRMPVFTDQSRLISPDGTHLTKDGARYVGERLFRHPLLRDLP